ncbi:hypothetical protein HDU85_006694 [Gaertneriomyces sp. JEL0708]|nr:hypothetical protein HDU85_006694 [Gaertneriomyces sp. JEL0708]
MPKTNTQVIFKEDPGKGWVEPKHMEVRKVDFDPDTVTLKEGEVLIKVRYISVDPYMRGRMDTSNKKSYSPPFEIGKPMTAGGIGEVYSVGPGVKDIKKGDIVSGMVEWAEWSICKTSFPSSLQKITVQEGIPLSWYLGILGMPGMTAYAGLLKIGNPKPGETVYVSAASGAVGLVVGQIAKAKGCRVVGSAGTDEKVKVLLEEAGFNAAFNYKTVDNLEKKLAELCPDGIDVNFENVGGEMLEAVLANMNYHGRVPLCGMISQYNAKELYGVKNLMVCVARRLLLKGFIVGDYYSPEFMAEFTQDMKRWIQEGKIIYKETIAEGLEKAPEAFVNMLKGHNTGKQVVKVA